MVVAYFIPDGSDVVFDLIRSAAEPWTTILVGAMVAPRYRTPTAIVLAVPLALFYGGGLLYLAALGSLSKMTIVGILNGLICFAACIGAVWCVQEESKGPRP